ncbi:MAG: hypothetical protein QOI88_3842 [Gammaproteobacteria bacterium]|jgi:hypothetical protein|nr:hypothetical protein [Gammaproteobacteria bacterium]
MKVVEFSRNRPRFTVRQRQRMGEARRVITI